MSETAKERAYVRRIERRFNALRESGLYVSPRDFALLLDWYERGVPADLVISAIEAVFQKSAGRSSAKRISSIAYCRRAVEEAWEERRAALLGALDSPTRETQGAFTAPEILAHLEACAAATEAAARSLARGHPPVPQTGQSLTAGQETTGDPTERLLSTARRLRDLRASLVQQPADLQSLEAELVKLEQEAVAAAQCALPPRDLEELIRATEDSFAAFSARMSDRARAATLRRALESAIRSRSNIPRYSLFAMAR